jgi:hypothetical protein
MEENYYNVAVSIERNDKSYGAHWSTVHKENMTQVLDDIERTFRLFNGESIEKIKVMG